jgi:glycosyltransferase involved in cell wall biosynthesis
MISTSDRGVGKNRNIALLNASGDYLIMADEDMIYKNGYEQAVIEAFKKNPKADMIVFEICLLNNITKHRKTDKRFKRVRIFNSLRYGTANIVIKRDSLQKANIWFSVMYGGGAPYTSGEDSLFICEALKKKLKIYTNPYIIADVKQEQSSCFHGYTEKYFTDKGIWLANAFPFIKYLLGFYYSYKIKEDTCIYNYIEKVKFIFKGIRIYSEKS